MKFKFLSKEKINRIPKNSGIYAFKNEGKILYIGKAANLRERVKNHFQRPNYRDYLFLDKVEKIGYIKTNSEIEALILEASLIKKYQPKYNITWRDDKNYFFVGKTEEDFPRIFLTHQKKVKNQKTKEKIEFVGPFVDGRALKQTLKILRKVFPYRSCSKLPKRACLWYHLNRCPGPCQINLKSPISDLKSFRLKLKEDCQKNTKNLIRILKEGKNPVLKELKKEMEKAARKEAFEKAAKIRDQISALEKVMNHSRIFESERLETKQKDWTEIEKELKKWFKTQREISRLEAYDISNIQGNMATGSMVTFLKGIPQKNFYRKFKIKISGKPNDLAMVKEVLTRRFKHPEWPYPDLILIDGGRAHLNIVREIKSQIPNLQSLTVALAKRENKLFIEGEKEPILLKNLPREIFNLILQLRDEAHRFALRYHQNLRKKALLEK